MEERVLITGGNGFVGKNLRLLYPDADILDSPSDICLNLPDKPYTRIFHLASKNHIPSCEADAEECIRVNCWGTINLIKCYPNARILAASSCLSSQIKSVYGATKAFVEFVHSLHKNYLAVKLYNIFGEHQHLENGAFTPKIIHHMLTKKPLSIYGDGTQFRDFTYVGDVVNNLKDLMDSDLRGVTHLGHGEPIMLNQYIEMIYGYMPEIEYLPLKDTDILWSKAPTPCRKWYGREEGLRRTIEWFKNEYHLA